MSEKEKEIPGGGENCEVAICRGRVEILQKVLELCCESELSKGGRYIIGKLIEQQAEKVPGLNIKKDCGCG